MEPLKAGSKVGSDKSTTRDTSVDKTTSITNSESVRTDPTPTQTRTPADNDGIAAGPLGLTDSPATLDKVRQASADAAERPQRNRSTRDKPEDGSGCTNSTEYDSSGGNGKDLGDNPGSDLVGRLPSG